MHLTDVITSIISALVQQLGVAEVVLLSSESWVSIAVFGKIQKRVRSLVIKISAKKNYRRLQNLISNFECTLRIYVTRLLKTLNFFFFAFHLIYHSKILFTCYKWKKRHLFFSSLIYVIVFPSVYITTNSDPTIVQVQTIRQRRVSDDRLATITLLHRQQGSHFMCVTLSQDKYR